ncbi:hypothetical protein LWC05_16010, partial [Acetobacter sicerae]|nr:hypothetical protein [Acetobacter sicerae]
GIRHIRWISQSLPAMFVSGNTSPCHYSLHLFAKTNESQHAGIVQKLSDQALSVIFDLIDTLLKGAAHYAMFSAEYWFRVPVYIVLCGIAIASTNRRFHMAFVSLGLVYEVSWILRHFETLS